jgi:hypothetical protein
VNPSQLLGSEKINFGNNSVTTLRSTQEGNCENYEAVFLNDENEKTVTVVLPDTFGNSRVGKFTGISW